MATSPLFIVFEGIDGSGKSTQAKLLYERFKKNQAPAYLTFEPTDSLIGSMIRNVLKGRVDLNQKTIAGLFVADRLDHIENPVNGMKKQLQEGKHVISDRYYFSSYAYHSSFMDMDWVIDANRLSAEMLKADITFYIEVSPEVSMNRIAVERDSQELYENLNQLQKTAKNYEQAFEKLSANEHIVRIDGNQSVEEIHRKVWSEVETFLAK